MTQSNVDPQEIHNFSQLADQWWDTNGQFKVLHDVNPARLAFIQQHTSLAKKHVLDVGCGGGILSEALAQNGARVTAIDMAAEGIRVAKQHARELDIDYRVVTVEQLAEKQPGHYDVITCMEMLEHVPKPESIIQACAKLAKPGAHLFFSTLNRTLPAYLLAILGAEYLLNIIPKNTHSYEQFIRPSELDSWLRTADLNMQSLKGLSYNPLTRKATLTSNVQVNYLLASQKN